MVPASFDEANVVLDKPDCMTADECEALSVLRSTTEGGHPVVISCWKLTQEELEEIKKTGRVWLVVFGATMPPCALSGVKPWGQATPPAHTEEPSPPTPPDPTC